MRPIFIVLTEGYSDWEIAVLSAIGRAFCHADIRFSSPDGGPLASAAGLSIADTEPFAVPDDGVVAVCGGPVFETADAPDLSVKLREAHAAGCVVAGICGGTIALARAGLLDAIRHTSNHPGYLEKYAPDYAGQALYVDCPYAISDGGIVTAPAPAPASFAEEVLKAAGIDATRASAIRRQLAAEHTS